MNDMLDIVIKFFLLSYIGGKVETTFFGRTRMEDTPIDIVQHILGIPKEKVYEIEKYFIFSWGVVFLYYMLLKKFLSLNKISLYLITTFTIGMLHCIFVGHRVLNKHVPKTQYPKHYLPFKICNNAESLGSLVLYFMGIVVFDNIIEYVSFT